MNFSRAIFNLSYQHCVFLLIFIAISFVLAIMFGLSRKKFGNNFALMTVVWATINFVIVIILLEHIHIPSEVYIEQIFSHIIKWMRINIGLDIFYGICGGILIWQGFKSVKYQQMLKGFGIAVILQGIGLLILDFIFLKKVDLLFRSFLVDGI